MGRKGKQKDYITATEWKDDYGGRHGTRYEADEPVEWW